MTAKTPIERANVLIEGAAPLTSAEKAKFAYFGVDAKILPPYRILNPQNVSIGDRTSIREHCHINAFVDLTFIHDYLDPRFRAELPREDYLYDGRIFIDHTCQIGRFAFMSCTREIRIEDHVVLSERVFIGDNNHGYAHREAPIMQQPNSKGEPTRIGRGSWIGAGAALLAGSRLGRNSVVGANCVIRRGDYPDRAVFSPPRPEMRVK
jgi:acetyltransferase-like isoleucine patch superfamily enzyme